VRKDEERKKQKRGKKKVKIMYGSSYAAIGSDKQ